MALHDVVQLFFVNVLGPSDKDMHVETYPYYNKPIRILPKIGKNSSMPDNE